MLKEAFKPQGYKVCCCAMGAMLKVPVTNKTMHDVALTEHDTAISTECAIIKGVELEISILQLSKGT